jgi:hypothetical protein
MKGYFISLEVALNLCESNALLTRRNHQLVRIEDQNHSKSTGVTDRGKPSGTVLLLCMHKHAKQFPTISMSAALFHGKPRSSYLT